jgi:hypothetical protein
MDANLRVTNSSVTITDYDRSKLALGGNYYRKYTVINLDGGAELVLPKGTLMGVITAAGANAGKLVPFDSTAVDGSAVPICVCNSDRTLAASAEASISMIIAGRVDESLLIFANDPTDGLDINIDTVGTPRNLLMANSVGINPEYVEDSTFYDN